MSDDKNRIQALERQLERERRYNEDLVKQNESLSEQVARLKGSISRHEVAVQTDSTPHSSASGEADWATQAQTQGGSIADSVKLFLASKSSEIQRKEFVYNEALGMYVNESNGMMYDGKRYLYYDYNKDEYMYYDEASGTYKEDPSRKKKIKPKKKTPKEEEPKAKDETNLDIVDLTYSDSEEGEVDDDEEENDEAKSKLEKVIPCVRMIVYSSKTLPPASLYIATCDRSFTFGRDAKRDMVLDEDLVSKYHAVMLYDKDTSSYRVQDFGSQNGTFLNSTRLSAPKEVSEKKEVTHHDLLVIGSTTLIVHIHENSETCDDCEPGVYLSKLQSFRQYAGNDQEDNQLKAQTSIKVSHKEEMKNIKKRYGIHKDHFMEVPAGSNPNDYVDRSKVRRIVVGSEHPSLAPKDAPAASVDVPIADNNVGFKLLSKMGWNEGEGLNSKRKMDSLTAPIATTIRLNEAAGLGAESVGEQLSLDDVRLRQQKEKWAKAAKRYHGLPTQAATDAQGKESASRSGNIQWVKGEKPTGTS